MERRKQMATEQTSHRHSSVWGDSTIAPRGAQVKLAAGGDGRGGGRFILVMLSMLVSSVIHDSYVALRLRAKVYVQDVQDEKARETDVTERVLGGLNEADIQPPAILHRTSAA